MSDEKEEATYLDQLDDLGDFDDYDVEVTVYRATPSFRNFIDLPFDHLSNRIAVECKTGQIKLPKEIVIKYRDEREWDFENYHRIELLALIYFDYYKNSIEWEKEPNLRKEMEDAMESLPHFRNISELFTYAYLQGDLKVNDFDQVFETEDDQIRDVTGLTEDDK